MVNKKVYVKFFDNIECIEFDKDTENEDLKGILKLDSFKSKLVNNLFFKRFISSYCSMQSK